MHTKSVSFISDSAFPLCSVSSSYVFFFPSTKVRYPNFVNERLGVCVCVCEWVSCVYDGEILWECIECEAHAQHFSVDNSASFCLFKSSTFNQYHCISHIRPYTYTQSNRVECWMLMRTIGIHLKQRLRSLYAIVNVLVVEEKEK